MRMNFKASMPDPRILIIQIVVVAVLASVFRNLLALFLLVLIVDFLLLYSVGGQFSGKTFYPMQPCC